MHSEVCNEMGGLESPTDYCSMCGEAWCSVRTNREIREAANLRKPNLHTPRRI
jgi:hypothetical protein